MYYESLYYIVRKSYKYDYESLCHIVRTSYK